MNNGMIIEKVINNNSKNISGPKNMTNEYDDIIKNDCTISKLSPLIIDASNPNMPMLNGPNLRWLLLITISSNKIK
jgi:hypothetical protein